MALSELPMGLASELEAEEVLKRPITIVGDDPRVDIMTVAWSVTFEQANRSKIVRRIHGVRVPYLSRNDLVRSKQTGRASDLADIEALTRRPSNAAKGRARPSAARKASRRKRRLD